MTSPTKFSLQNTDASQDCSCMSKNMTKWQISAHEGSRKPLELGRRGRGEGIETRRERRVRVEKGGNKRKESVKKVRKVRWREDKKVEG